MSTLNDICLRHELFVWETVKLLSYETGSNWYDGKGIKQSEMFNNYT